MTNPSSPASVASKSTAEKSLATEGNYHSISTGAIGVLIAGLFSPLAFLSPAMWFVPFAVLLGGVWVLRQLAANSERLTGGYLAWIGLTIALVVMGWAPARYVSSSSVLLGEARQVADAWVELMNQRKLMEAHQWHLLSSERAKPGTTLEAFYSETPQRREDMTNFLARKGIAHWLTLDATQATYVSCVKINRFADASEIFLQYRVVGTRQGEPAEFSAYVILVRREVDDGKFEMILGNVMDEDPVPLDDN